MPEFRVLLRQGCAFDAAAFFRCRGFNDGAFRKSAAQKGMKNQFRSATSNPDWREQIHWPPGLIQ
jgi:hypothetical protein